MAVIIINVLPWKKKQSDVKFKSCNETCNFGDPGMYIYICTGCHLDTYFVAIYLRISNNNNSNNNHNNNKHNNNNDHKSKHNNNNNNNNKVQTNTGTPSLLFRGPPQQQQQQQQQQHIPFISPCAGPLFQP